MEAKTPSDQEVIDAPSWRISEARLKKLAPSVNKMNESTKLGIPDDARAAQSRYKKDGTRTFRIYGRGEHNYGVSLNADMAILFNIMYARLLKVGVPQTTEDKNRLASTRALQIIWDYYVAAAAAAGVARQEVGAQLEAEFGVPWRYMPTPPGPERTWPEAEAVKAAYKTKSLKMTRTMRQQIAEARALIPVDGNGDVVWDEAKNDQYAMLVVRIDKGDGLREFGEV
ncbi:Uu.00g116840.m01.CDS01 [Anthostomella pinea]|uniref:Uu.00g116840.m01.CDS01 n=1 Tax=Anthostomella pinea TaxID=933095 RepID=A0AAI8YGS6_9PEZI|nr:Uu.00g116840.m01.CDS01 [Anthostomella pinea]